MGCSLGERGDLLNLTSRQLKDGVIGFGFNEAMVWNAGKCWNEVCAAKEGGKKLNSRKVAMQNQNE